MYGGCKGRLRSAIGPLNINIAIEEYANAGLKYLAALMLDDLKFT